MTPEEFALARQKIGLSDERLAAELGVNPKTVRAWINGSVRIPKHDAQMIAWRAALEERQKALEEARIPYCDWVKDWEAKPIPPRTEDMEAHFKTLDAHTAQCPTCQERERFVRERFGAMPEMPVSGLASTFLAWQRFLDRFPGWTHPVWNGAAIVTVLVLFRVLIAVPRGATPLMLIAIPAGAAFGAIGGLAYSALRPYIATGGARKTFAHILVLLAYATAGFAVVDVGERISSGLALFGSIGLWSFVAVAAIVVFFWRVSAKRKPS
jgi:transcriptional regulator with XRE-family HTH domain